MLPTPIGIKCTIVNGQAASSNCGASFPRALQVKLSARSSSIHPRKAWAGGGCEVAGSGTGESEGSGLRRVTATSRWWSASMTRPARSPPGGPVGPPHQPGRTSRINAVLLPNGKVFDLRARGGIPGACGIRRSRRASPGLFERHAPAAAYPCCGTAGLSCPAARRGIKTLFGVKNAKPFQLS